MSYIVTTSATWLTATPAGGTTPGTLSAGVTPSGLAGHEGELEDSSSPSRRLLVSSTGGSLQSTAEAMGGSWLSVSPAGGTTPARVTVGVSSSGLARGSYKGQIKLSAPGVSSITVPVTPTVGGQGDDGESFSASTHTYDPANTGAVAAAWVSGTGVPANNVSDATTQGLVLTNNAGASSKARSGVVLNNVAGITLHALGFDLRQGSLCSASEPRLIVVTSDSVVHTISGCTAATLQSAPAKGWSRYRFHPAQAVPAIAPDATVKSVALRLDEGPEAGTGMVVLDNINVNGTFIGHE